MAGIIVPERRVRKHRSRRKITPARPAERPVAAAGIFGIVGTAVPALAATHEFSGRVLHVSTDNIKVKNMPSGKTLSFLVVPHFDQVFQFDGKTTYQMKRLPGKRVKVY